MDRAELVRRPVAHRGYHDASAGRIENTLGAIRAAVERGFAIEVDLQLSRDGEAMVFHDETLDRLTTETGRLDARTAAELKDIRFKATDDRIPTLQDLLDAVQGRSTLVIEIKSEYPRVPDDRLARRTAEVLKAYRGPVACMSFDPNVLIALQRAAPDLMRGIVADDARDPVHYPGVSKLGRASLRHLLHIPRTRPHFVAYWVKRLPSLGPTFTRKVLKLPLLTWTVRTPEDRAVAAREADQMIFEGFDPEA
jgi:glycerophosphoryl diester phosphodiesterase